MQANAPIPMQSAAPAAQSASDHCNPLLSDFELPPFDLIGLDDYEPAIAAALAEAEANVRAIVENSEAPTFANTIEALERADGRLGRVSAILINLNECCTSEPLQQIVERVEPQLTRFANRVSTDEALFRRIERVYAEADRSALDAEQQTLLERTYRSFVRHGAQLEGEAKEEYRRIGEELASLKVRFAKNALADTNRHVLHLTKQEELEGLPPSVVEAAEAEAKSREMEGWVFTLSAPSYVPFMTYSARADLRERMYRAYGSVGNAANEFDNNEVIRRIVQLRARLAQLLGFDTYCDYVVADRMVESRQGLEAFMQRMVKAVRPHAEADLECMARYASEAEGAVHAWDISYLTERVRRAHYDLDTEALRPYFPLPQVLKGVFGLYGKLYGLRFEEAKEVPVYHQEVRVYRVSDGNRELGLLYLDLHPRPEKRSGAWMTEFRGQHGMVRPQIQVVCNFSKPTADAPALLRFAEVETFMHEMGHAMHGMLSEVRYESLGGTNVLRDFVEMPSQVMENWCYEPAFLATFAQHWQSGEPLPEASVRRLVEAKNLMAAWLCLRQLNLGLTDLAFHTRAEAAKAEGVEAEAMINLVPRVEGCCTATNFNHIFSGGYAAGYYGYKWAEVLDADIFSRFKADGIFNATTAAEFRQSILSRGGTEHPAVLFRRFMHRDPDPDALLRRMGIGQ